MPDKVINPSVAESNLAKFQSRLFNRSFQICIVSAFRMPCAIGCHSFPVSLESTVSSLDQSAERRASYFLIHLSQWDPFVSESNLAKFQSWLPKRSFKIIIVRAFRMPCAIGCHSFPGSLESTVSSPEQRAERSVLRSHTPINTGSVRC